MKRMIKEQLASRRFWICVTILLFDIFLAAITLVLQNISLDGWGTPLTVLNLTIPAHILLSGIEKIGVNKFTFQKGDIKTELDVSERN
ncbi:MAG: hypothetical protein LBB61_07855 [Treponema sp.]|jgi:hypothetical protein|nr:hypothetical protein [Treponema sp.]